MARPQPGRTVVVLGMMSAMPVGGVVWQTLHYLLGLERLGFTAHYVEAHHRTPGMLMASADDDGDVLAADFVSRTLRPFGFEGRWAYVAPDHDGRCFGMSRLRLAALLRSASVVLNLHGGTAPRPELAATGRLVHVDTDPVLLHLELAWERPETVAFMEPHAAAFTFAENQAGADCGLPRTDVLALRPTRQPVVLDLWQDDAVPPGDRFTTIGNWRQQWRSLVWRDEVLTWSKDHEFRQILDLPGRTGQPLELALASLPAEDRAVLERHGWRVRDALGFSLDPAAYRRYVLGSRGELSVAKEQNVRLRTGWFSDRSATYLAAGRPVVVQDTGFGSALPTGEGLFAFRDAAEAAEALERIGADHARHSRAARDIAREFFAHDVVLGRLLREAGIEFAGRRGRRADPPALALPDDLVLEPVARRPVRLEPRTVAALVERPVAPGPRPPGPDAPEASVVVVTRDNLPLLRLCLESVLAHTPSPAIELVVVDNASSDGTPAYLDELARRRPEVAVVRNRDNRGFPAAANQGLARAAGEVLVLMNDDVAVAPEWLARLAAHLRDPGVGLVGPATNRIGNEAEVETGHRTWGGFLRAAAERAAAHDGATFALPTPAMFCVAIARDAHERVGPLDERFGVGTLEDDDYALRARAAGLATVGAEDVLVHHVGEASFGRLVPGGERDRVLEENRRRFEEKWGRPWRPYGRRPAPAYAAMRQGLRDAVAEHVPPGATVLVVSRGDEALLALDGRCGWHFPQTDGGVYAGHHPADSADAIAQLEAMRRRGGEFLAIPETGRWWLDHYAGLRGHLDARYRRVLERDGVGVLFALGDGGGPG